MVLHLKKCKFHCLIFKNVEGYVLLFDNYLCIFLHICQLFIRVYLVLFLDYILEYFSAISSQP